jgi:hypothetical protein
LGNLEATMKQHEELLGHMQQRIGFVRKRCTLNHCKAS